MAVMQIGIVVVLMNQARMPMQMCVRFGRHACRMIVLMMFVMNVHVIVFHRLMLMRMLVSFRQMEPESDRHQDPADHEGGRDRLVQ